MRSAWLAAPVLFLVAVAGCGGSSTAPDLGFLVQANGTPPTSATAGTAVQVAVKVLHKESGGATTPVSGKVVTLTVTAGGGTVNGATSATVTTATDGTVTATWQLGAALGPQTLRGSVSATEFVDFTLTATQPRLILTSPPSATALSGAPLAQQPTVQLQDDNGHNVTQANVAITAAIETGGGTLTGTLTVSTNASGAAVFTDLVISGIIGNRTLKFTATLNGTPATVSSGAIALAPGAAAQLAITTQPSATALSGVALVQQPAIQVQDAAGNNVALAGAGVTASVATGGAALSGTTTVTTDPTGAATFTNLTLTGGVGPATLGFAATLAGQTRSITSAVVGLTLPPKVTLATSPTTAPMDGIPFFRQPVAQLADGAGTPIHQAGVAVTASVASGPGTLTVAAPATITVNTDANGQAAFADLQLNGIGDYTLQFAAPGYTTLVTGTVSVTAATSSVLDNGDDHQLPDGGSGTLTYFSFPPPAGTTELQFGISTAENGVGSVNLYARHGRFPTSTNFDCRSNSPIGPSQQCIPAANLTAPWFVVVEGVATYHNEEITPLAYGPSCPRRVLPIDGTVLGGTLSPSSCTVGDNPPFDRFLVTMPSFPTTQALRFVLTTTGATSLHFRDGHSMPFNSDIFDSPGGTMPPVLLPPGTYEVQPRDEILAEGGGQTYTLNATMTSPDLASCGPVNSSIAGVNVTLHLAATDCPGFTPGTFSDRIYLTVGDGQTLTVTLSSADFDPSLRLLDTQTTGTTFADIIQTNTGLAGTPGTAATLVYKNPPGGGQTGVTNDEDVMIEASSLLAGKTGTYTLTINIDVNSYAASPPVGTPALRAVPPRPRSAHPRVRPVGGRIVRPQ